MTLRAEIQQAATRIDHHAIARAVAAAKRGDRAGRVQLSGIMAWVACSCPDATHSVYSNIATAWLGSGPMPEIPVGLAEAPLEDSFWEAFWTVVEGPPEGYDALTITIAVAALAGALHPDFEKIAENHARRNRGDQADSRSYRL
jgi:hypothetical protein